MSEVLNKLKVLGQCLSSELASHLSMTQRAVNAALYPHVVSGNVMSCTVITNGRKQIEYRLSGTLPHVRPGPKIVGKA
jgi:hypothetical protein